MSVLSEAVAAELLKRVTKKANTRRRAEAKEARAAAREEAKAAKASEEAGQESQLDLAGDLVDCEENVSSEPAKLIGAANAHEDASGAHDDEGAEANDDASGFVEADGLLLTTNEVEKILRRCNIPTSASRAIPVPLRAIRVQFSGIKVLPITHRDAVGHDPLTDADLAALIGSDSEQDSADEVGSDEYGESPVATEGAQGAEPAGGSRTPSAAIEFDWTWEPQTGVNGIGSGKNLRGKSTVLNVLMWALSGRCGKFQPDVKSWIRTVQVDWRIGSEHIRVKFKSSDGHPNGTVDLVEEGTGTTEKTMMLGVFDGEEQFEGVMGSVMMSRLRLEEIPVWTVDRSVRHKWPAYASAFTVRADTLNPVVGNVTELGIRMLQMFVGTNWGPALAATSTALGELEAEKATASNKASTASDVIAEAKAKAQTEVERLTEALNAIPAGAPDIRDIIVGASIATDHARTLREVERQLMIAAANVDTIKLQLRTAQARNHTVLEDKLATRFFHQMTPSRCPRCTAAVTAEQKAAEVDKHECSLCAKDLELEEVDIRASGISAEPEGDDIDLPANDVEALQEALAEAEAASEALAGRIAIEQEALAAAEQASQRAQAQAPAAEDRRKLELALAHAQGALTAFGDASDPKTTDNVDPTTLAVLTIAENVLKEWMRDGQNPLLNAISEDIEALAVGFGADSLSNVRLGGGGVMRLVKHGKPMTYSGVTDGERLRLKIATAVALIKHGSVAGVGRHPGFLVLDSPAAEEMPEEDLGVLIKALRAVADEAEMQIFVGTRNTGPLLDLLEPRNRVIAVGEGYLW